MKLKAFDEKYKVSESCEKMTNEVVNKTVDFVNRNEVVNAVCVQFSLTKKPANSRIRCTNGIKPTTFLIEFRRLLILLRMPLLVSWIRSSPSCRISQSIRGHKTQRMSVILQRIALLHHTMKLAHLLFTRSNQRSFQNHLKFHQSIYQVPLRT